MGSAVSIRESKLRDREPVQSSHVCNDGKLGCEDTITERTTFRAQDSLGDMSVSETLTTTTYDGESTRRVKRPQLCVTVKEYSFDENVNRESSESESTTPTRRESRVHFSPKHGSLSIGNFTINKSGLRLGESETIPHSLLLHGKCDFTVVGKLGTGTSGSVFEALHMPTLTVVALKMLPIYELGDLQHIESELGVLLKNLAELRLIYSILSSSSSDVSHIEDWLSGEMSLEPKEAHDGLGAPPEARRTSRNYETVCACPQLLAMYDAFLDPINGMVNLVVEYMDGGSLEDVVQNGGCQNEAVLADITRQVLNGVTFLHEQKQIHRDIKPGNILLSSTGMVKLADFGISKAMEINDGDLAVEHKFVGTLRYMAPERISNEPYGYAADIWSIGLTILAVVFGRYPLGPSNGDIGGYWDLLRFICDEDIPMPNSSHFSQELIDLLSGCLIKDPARRISLKSLSNHDFLSVFGGCKGESEEAGQVSGCPMDFERVIHLTNILEKVQQRYMQGDVLMSASFSNSFRGSFHSEKDQSSDSNCINKWESRKTPKLPGFEDQQWVHLADQLHVPPEKVIAMAKAVVSPDFIRHSHMNHTAPGMRD